MTSQYMQIAEFLYKLTACHCHKVLDLKEQKPHMTTSMQPSSNPKQSIGVVFSVAASALALTAAIGFATLQIQTRLQNCILPTLKSHIAPLRALQLFWVFAVNGTALLRSDHELTLSSALASRCRLL